MKIKTTALLLRSQLTASLYWLKQQRTPTRRISYFNRCKRLRRTQILLPTLPTIYNSLHQANHQPSSFQSIISSMSSLVKYFRPQLISNIKIRWRVGKNFKIWYRLRIIQLYWCSTTIKLEKTLDNLLLLRWWWHCIRSVIQTRLLIIITTASNKRL